MMNLFADVEAENDKYINAIDALEFTAKKINYGVSDIARRLLLDKFNQIACMFKINDYGKIDLWCSEKEFNGDYASTTEFLKIAVSTLGTFEYTQEDTWGNEYEYTKDEWLDHYWLKSDFFEFDTIKKLKILENDLEEFLNTRTQEAIADLFVSHDIIKHTELTKKTAADISQKFLREQKEFDSNEDLEETTPYIPLFYLNDTFSLIEASCLISRDDPIQMNRCFHDTNFDQNYPYFNEAYNFINSAIWAGNLPENTIPSHQLKTYLLSKGKVINGFNDNLPTQDHTNIGQPSTQHFEPNIESLNAEITQLSKVVADKDKTIKELQELINQLESEQPTEQVEDALIGELTGLTRRNQLAQDRQGMARIIALSLWNADGNILIGDMANKVYAIMVDYCRDGLPQTPETIKNWIRPIATPQAQQRGRKPQNQ